MAQAKDYVPFTQARYLLALRLNASFGANLKNLLETKHLYQSISLDFEAFADDIGQNILLSQDKMLFEQFVNEECQQNLTPSETQVFRRVQGVPLSYAQPTLLIQNVKLFCSRCKQRETFSPTLYYDATEAIKERMKEYPRTAMPPSQFQMFVLVFQCEACKTIPVAFLVKRLKWKLWLEGRSPIEEVDVPAFLPKPECKLFSDAVVAAQTGNGLAGIFYLRCFIEQFARRQTGVQERKPGDDIVGEYQSLIPEKQRDHMPSLRYWYEKLSVPIHTGKDDEALFEEAKADVLLHFDFRRLFRIEDRNTERRSESNASKTEGGD